MFNGKHPMIQHLPTWAQELLQALEIEPVQVNIEALEELAQTIPDNTPDPKLLVGFIAGYAAGLAEGSDMASFERAHSASVQFMRKYLTRE